MGEENTSVKQRSAAYPAATMESCRDILNAIKALGGKNCSYQTLADKLGVNVTTYSFKAKISSSKQYGFIENVKNVIQLSERGRLLVYPTQNVTEKEILLGCFQNPTLYGKIIQNFLGKLFRRGLLGSGIFIIFIKLFYTNETSLRVKFHIPSTKAV